MSTVNSSMHDSMAQPSEFHTLVDTACSIIEAPHQQNLAASPTPGILYSYYILLWPVQQQFIMYDISGFSLHVN